MNQLNVMFTVALSATTAPLGIGDCKLLTINGCLRAPIGSDLDHGYHFTQAVAICIVVQSRREWSAADALPYLHIFEPTDGPEVLCQVVVRDVVVRHGEVTLDAPVPAPRVTDKRTFG
jgi:hypothetical protein